MRGGGDRRKMSEEFIELEELNRRLGLVTEGAKTNEDGDEDIVLKKGCHCIDCKHEVDHDFKEFHVAYVVCELDDKYDSEWDDSCWGNDKPPCLKYEVKWR